MPEFIRGDCNNDGLVIGFVGDIIFILQFLFAGGPSPSCLNACDANDDESVDISDALYLLNWQWAVAGSPPPPPPTPMLFAVGSVVPFLGDCGPDPSPGPLACVANICP